MTEKQTVKLLKAINRRKNIPRIELNRILEDESFIDPSFFKITVSDNSDYDLFELSDKGIDYLHQHKKDIVRMWLPHIISNTIAFLALILSIVSIAMQLSQ